MSVYVPLWCKSHYSFLEGTCAPDTLVEEAYRLGLPSLALTDRDGVYGIVRAHMQARTVGTQLLTGAQVTVSDGSSLLLLAQDRRGYAHLCRLLTTGRLRSPKGQSAVTWQEITTHAPGLLALWGGEGSLLAQESEPLSVARLLLDAFGDRLYALLTRHRQANEVPQERHLRTHAARYGLPLVAATEVLYHSPRQRPLQDVLTCIRHHVTLSTAGRRIKPNAEHALLTPEAFTTLFADVPAAVAQTVEVAARCTFSLTELRYRYPVEHLPSGCSPMRWLYELTLAGARQRYPGGIPPAVVTQLETELALIESLDYGGYFLTMHEIVEFCRARGILCQGRGSAANSAVCYCLGITAIDPVRMDLLFERFLSRERAEPPDIDLDIMHTRREEVIQHVYERYGPTHAAMVANVVRYRPRSAVREVGKVLGLPATTLDRLAKLLSHDSVVSTETLRQAGIEAEAPVSGHLLRLTNALLDCPRHLSLHPGGFVLGHEPVNELVPIEPATMPGRTVIQWDKTDLEALGLFKVDLLGLGALTQLDLCLQLLRHHRGITLSLATIPPEDAETFAMIGRSDTVGVFQIESRAQMAMLPRLAPQSLYDLIIEVSIVRPGPIAGGMVHPYLQRRSGVEPVTYPHPALIPVLQKTLGVPLFQEQVMKLAIVAADYTPGEADQLRRDMAAWQRSGRIEQHRERLVTRMIAKGISPAFAEQVFRQIRGFGEYGFPESHAASFALLSYASAYLKCHYPAEFTCALLNAQPMGFYSIATIIEDAKRHGVTIVPIDICHSQWQCTLEPMDAHAWAVRMGLRFVKGLGEKVGDTIITAREACAYRSLADFVHRTRLEAEGVSRLAAAGALTSLEGDRRTALWEGRGLVRRHDETLTLPSRDTTPVFAPLTPDEVITWDHRTTCHSPRGHLLQPLRPFLQAHGLPEARKMGEFPDRTLIRYVGIVITRQRPSTAKGVVFLTLEDETGFVNVVLWPQVFRRHVVLAKTARVLGVTGRLQVQAGVVHLIAKQLWIPRLPNTPTTNASRDFR